MPSLQKNSAGAHDRSLVVTVAAAAVMLIGSGVLAVWLLGIDSLIPFPPGETAMKANSALAFIISGIALLFLQTPGPTTSHRIRVCALAVAALSLLTLAQYLTGINFLFDDLFVHADLRTGPAAAGRMSPAAALSFLLTAGALGWMSKPQWETRPSPLIPSYLGACVFVIGSVASIGYLAGFNAWRAWWNPTGMPILTSITFKVLGLALFIQAFRRTATGWQISGWLTAGFVGGVVALVGVAADSYRSTKNLVEASTEVRHTLNVIGQIRQVEHMLEAEQNDLRAFLLTGNEAIASNYSERFPAVQRAFAELLGMTAGHADQRSRLTRLMEGPITERHQFLESLVAVRRTRGFSDVTLVAAAREINALSAPLHAGLREITASEERTLTAREKNTFEITQRTFAILPVGVLASVVLLSLGLLRLHGEVVARQRETERRRENEERLDLALTVAQMGTWDLDLTPADPARQSLKCSSVVGPLFGRHAGFTHTTLQECMGQVHPDDREHVMSAFSAALNGKKFYDAEYRVVWENGAAVHWLATRGAVLRDDAGRPIRALGVVIDITERKNAEEILRENELQMRLALQGGDLGLWDWNVATSQLVVSERWLTMLGLKPDDPPPTIASWHALIHPDDIAKLNRLIHEVILAKSGRNFEAEVRARHRDGHYIWILDRGAVVSRAEDGSPLRVAGTHMEITARKQAEEKIQLLNAELEQRVADRTRELSEANVALINFKAALDEHAIVAITDAQGRITYANDNFCAISRYAREELIGQDHRLINSEHHSKAFIRDLWDTIQSGRVWKGEIRNRAKDGSLYWVNSTIVPFLGPDGNPVQYIAIRNDITPRIEAEENIRQLNTDLESRAQKLESANRELEAFSYSVSHDLRAPLRAIDGFSRMLLEEQGGRLDEEGQRMLTIVCKEAGRMGQLIDDLLAFARISRQQTAPVEIDMRAMAQDAFNELIAREPKRALQLDLHALPPAYGTPPMIRQVWANLVGNAVKFTRKRPLGLIEIGANVEENGSCVYFVKDNGAGFNMRNASKLFGVFQRMHAQPDFEGTGVGLALVQRIVQRHGGRVWAEAEVDQGAQFFFTLPLPKP